MSGPPCRWPIGLLGLAAAVAGGSLGFAADPPPALRADRYGDPLPEGARARLGTVRWRAGGGTQQVAFSPDGKTVVAASNDGLAAWDAATGRPLDRFPRVADRRLGGASAIAYSPDGKLLATASMNPVTDKDVRLWDVATGRELPFADSKWPPAAASTVPRSIQRLSQLSFASDGKTLAGLPMSGPNMPLWAVPSGKLIAKLNHSRDDDQAPRPGRRCAWMAYAPDSQTLYTAAGGSPAEVFVWEAATGKRIRTMRLPDRTLAVSLALSPGGETIAADNQGRLSLMDTTTGRERKSIDTGGRHYLSLVYVDDGQQIAGRHAGGVDFYDVDSEERRSAQGSHSVQRAGGRLYASAKGALVALSDHGENALNIFDAKTGRNLNDPTEFARDIATLAITPDGRTVVAAAAYGDSRIRRWDISEAKNLSDASARLDPDRWMADRRATALSPDGRLIAVVALDSGNAINRRLPAGLPAAPLSEIVTVLNTETGEKVQALANSQSRSLALAWSPDSKTLAVVAAGHAVQLWDVATGKPGRKLTTEAGEAWKLAFSSDGKLLATADMRPATAVVWDVATGEVQRKLGPEINGTPICLALSSDNKTLAIGIRRGLRRFDIGTGHELPMLEGPEDAVAKCLFSPDGRLVLAFSMDGSLWAWNAANGQRKQKLAGHGHAVTSMAMTPDGKTLVTGSTDTTILLWDLAGW